MDTACASSHKTLRQTLARHPPRSQPELITGPDREPRTMSDDDETEPAVELGEGPNVDGAPLARVASRLTWPQERSRIEEKEGDAVIRTPDGPRELTAVLEEVDETYFDRRQTFLAAVRDVIGHGPIATE